MNKNSSVARIKFDKNILSIPVCQLHYVIQNQSCIHQMNYPQKVTFPHFLPQIPPYLHVVIEIRIKFYIDLMYICLHIHIQYTIYAYNL